MPDASWPNLPVYRTGPGFTPAEHAAHRTPKGVQTAESLMGVNASKAAKTLLKAVKKPHLKLNKSRTRVKRRRKEKA